MSSSSSYNRFFQSIARILQIGSIVNPLLLMKHVIPEPEEDDGDEGDDEEHEEADCDPDEGGGVQAESLGGGQVDHHL